MNKFKRFYIIRKDIVQRNFFKKFEKNYLFIKFLKLNKRLLELNNYLLSLDNYNLYFNYSLNNLKILKRTHIKNKCLITGRTRSIYRDFRLSRMQLRNLASFGYLNGIRKSSW